MTSMKINFGDVEGSFEALPEGAYPVIIEKVERRESKSSEHDYLNWELTVSEGEHKERKLWMITSLSPRALWKLKDVLDALGYDTEGELDFEFDDQAVEQSQGPLLLSPQLAGEPAIAVVKNELYNEKERNRVEELVSPAPPGPKKSSNGAPKKAGGRKLC